MPTPAYTPGEPIPAFHARSAGNPRFAFDTTAGRWLMLLIPGPLGAEGVAPGLAAMIAPHAGLLHADRAFLVVIGTDPADERAGRLTDGPGRRVLWDDDGSARRALRAVEPDGTLRTGWVLLDPMLRVFAIWPLEAGAEAMATLAALPPPAQHAGVPLTAPVLVLPRVFEPAFCQRLIATYEAVGGGESGFMRDVGGRTVGVMDPSHKRRKDLFLEDEALRAQIRARLNARLVPEIARAFNYRVTRLERYVVACYDAADQGFFRAHRDNTTKATAHRRFACTLNLNTGDYEGGDLCFPEFGPQTYRAPAGGAVVFSCSLLHEARPVTRGRRYAFLPFLYDDAAAAIREEGAKFLGQNDAIPKPSPVEA
ncbi:2OG-Fe(II) oxygenase [Falsiroseomonas selenitidurans]|uniref:2OG-Fe(II) oxygenase n=1 Tax=Falsiroseomonas selenitidurans TaxID=2716335 RepID=A0ABX1E1P5_9PROT|nr:2OG-Fe(II) oxygenase [Falsiroseomonas selenitidurans]NKC31008.1 2OG-Fe(II) oxygenase [Falsiroseomonas selenitidurans]